MNKTHHILVPELVPLENKGEEAIVRGIADVVFPDGNYELHLFDEIDQYQFQDRIHVYPVKWFMSPWLNREFGLGMSYEKLRNSLQSLIRNLLHKFIPNWVRRKDAALLNTMQEVSRLKNTKNSSKGYPGLENIINLDYIIAGHDGAMDERVCHVISEFRQLLNIPLGIFGIEFPQAFKSEAIVEEQHKVLKDSLFFYCRTESSKRVVDQNFPLINARVQPDPAFSMKPVSSHLVDEYLIRKGLVGLFEKEVIVCTTCETGPIARYCFQDEHSPAARIEAHRNFYADFLEYVASKNNINVIFLPHSLGPGRALDDTVVARDVMKRMQNKSNVVLLDDDISAAMLKGIIKKSNFLIAERIHSMIGATGVGTPFLCLGSNTDRRIKGIISEMVGANNSIYYMNSPDLKEVCNIFDSLWDVRVEEGSRLDDVIKSFSEQHEASAVIIRKAFNINE
jgi:polysaccharide pyruvyl transferase WcaK-like protein